MPVPLVVSNTIALCVKSWAMFITACCLCHRVADLAVTTASDANTVTLP